VSGAAYDPATNGEGYAGRRGETVAIDDSTGARTDTAALAAAVLEEEAARQDAQARAREQVIFPDDLLPGVNAEPMTFRQGLKVGGAAMFVVLTILNSLDELEGAAINVLAPEIRETFGISKGAVVFISTASAAFFVLGAVPMGWLSDRMRRVPLVGISSLFFSFFVFLSGLATSAFMLFWTRFGTGIAKANTIPVHQSLIADNYPIGIRARLAGLNNLIGHGLSLASPVLVGGIAALAGGTEGWRWAWFVLGVPVGLAALGAFALHEPPRGQFEKLHVLGEVIDEENPAPISMEAAFARMKKIRTLRTVLVAFCALGFGIFSQGSMASLYLEETLKVDSPLHRGIVLSLSGIPALPVLLIAATYFDKTYRVNPAKALAIVGALILPSALFMPLRFSTHSEALFILLDIPQAVLITAAFAMVGPVLQAVVPYRLRGMGTAMATMYIFFIGGFGGGIIAGFLTDGIGIRGTVIVLGIPTSVIGGLLIMNGARFIRNDLSLVVEELLEEQSEHRKRAVQGSQTPVLQAANIDFSYGAVQVLFDVNFEIMPGECVALLGTNGAGKSTILRVLSGLEVPERGVVRLNGRNITYVAPEQRVRLGIVQLPGGKGVFPSLTVQQNLAVSARLLAKTRAEVDERIAGVLELFPELTERRNQPARSLSGGQQQMLALARVLIHKPEILLIDELSLGLAPVVVQRMLELVDRLKASGQTMIVVEQSLNVALAISDRAIFLEKGEVKFEGATRDLVERDDLARAVFFGTEGG
jgi:ABC-type branched-subunit amino acid transport system ATPase component/predicted MFS family arabinose efflux permease